MATTLPPELLSDILCRLPTKNIIRCKCVSKSFKSLIESPDFINQHLHRSLNSSSNHLLVISLYPQGLHILPLDSTLQRGGQPIKQRDPPVMLSASTIEVFLVGSCHGLLCLFNTPDRYILYNPTTRTRHSFPHFPVDHARDNGSSVALKLASGFGYDAKRDDYKVVVLCRDEGLDLRELGFQVYVCGVKEDSGWRRIGDVTGYAIYPQMFDPHGAFVNGGLHWIVARNLHLGEFDKILRFDLAEEMFSVMELPDFGEDEDEGEEGETEGLGVLGGCLRLTRHYDGDFYCETWVMKEYGVKESWTKLITHTEDPPVRPIAYCRDGSKVLLRSIRGQFSWYNLKSETSSNVHRESIERCFMEWDCLESLILLGETTHKD